MLNVLLYRIWVPVLDYDYSTVVLLVWREFFVCTAKGIFLTKKLKKQK